MRSSSHVEVDFPDNASADAAMKAISHEGDIGGRSKMSLSKKGSTLRLDIDAQDVVALRACLNACLRALQVFEGIEVRK